MSNCDEMKGCAEVKHSNEDVKKNMQQALFDFMFSGLHLVVDTRMQQMFGNPAGNKFLPNWMYLDQQFDIFDSEVNELRTAINEGDFTGVLDGLGDCLTVLNAIANAAGVDLEEVHRAVQVSNLTKFCRSDEELEATVAKYAAMGVATVAHGDFPFKCLRTDGPQVIDGKAVRGGKFLKCINFKEPDFTDVMRPPKEVDEAVAGLKWVDLSPEQREAMEREIRNSKPLDDAQKILAWWRNRRNP